MVKGCRVKGCPDRCVEGVRCVSTVLNSAIQHLPPLAATGRPGLRDALLLEPGAGEEDYIYKCIGVSVIPGAGEEDYIYKGLRVSDYALGSVTKG